MIDWVKLAKTVKADYRTLVKVLILRFWMVLIKENIVFFWEMNLDCAKDQNLSNVLELHRPFCDEVFLERVSPFRRIF